MILYFSVHAAANHANKKTFYSFFHLIISFHLVSRLTGIAGLTLTALHSTLEHFHDFKSQRCGCFFAITGCVHITTIAACPDFGVVLTAQQFMAG